MIISLLTGVIVIVGHFIAAVHALVELGLRVLVLLLCCIPGCRIRGLQHKPAWIITMGTSKSDLVKSGWQLSVRRVRLPMQGRQAATHCCSAWHG